MKLLSNLAVSRNELDKSMSHLSSLLDLKNLAEYEDRMPTRNEAELAMRDVERFRRWALSKLPQGDRHCHHA